MYILVYGICVMYFLKLILYMCVHLIINTGHRMFERVITYFETRTKGRDILIATS